MYQDIRLIGEGSNSGLHVYSAPAISIVGIPNILIG